MQVTTPGGRGLGWVGNFAETNVRTYVTDPRGRSGIWFFSLDAARLGAVSVARATYRLPYFWSAMDIDERADRITYRCKRRWPGPLGARSDLAVGVGDAYQADELSDLDHFLTARWVLFSSPGAGRPRARFARAQHQPCPLRRAEVVHLDDELVTATGLPAPGGEALVHYAHRVDVRVARPRPVS